MKKNFFLKCFLTLCMVLFLSMVPFPIIGNVVVAEAGAIPSQSDIKLNVKSLSLVKDTTYELKVYNVESDHKVTYKTDDADIAEVDKEGVITANDFGEAIITVTIKDGYKTIDTLECEVTVGPPAFSIKLTKSEITLEVGHSTNLITILKPSRTAEDAKFFSNRPSIASVSTGGRVTANKPGVAFVFASLGNGKYDLCRITVVKES